MSERLTYLITDLAGAWIAGYRRPATPTIQLTPEEAEYDLRVGTITLTSPLPVPPVAPLQAGDVLRIRRGLSQLDVPIEVVEAYLARVGGRLAAELERRGDAIGVAVGDSVLQRVTSLEALVQAQTPANRLAALRAMLAALPPSSDGLAPNEAYRNGDTVAFVPAA